MVLFCCCCFHLRNCSKVPFICRTKSRNEEETQYHDSNERCRSNLLQVVFGWEWNPFFPFSHFPYTLLALWPILNIPNTLDSGCFHTQLRGSVFQQALVMFSISASSIGVNNHFMYTTWESKTDAPFNLTPHHFRASARAFPRWASSSRSEMHQACVGELLNLSSWGSNLWAICRYHGECFPDTSWTYMYQGFDIFAIFSPGPPMAVVLRWCHKGSQNTSDCLSRVH